MRWLRWTLATFVLTAACQKSSSDDTAAISKTRDAWTVAWKSGNAAQIAALYDESGASMQNHTSTNEGRIAIASALGGQFAQFTPNDISLSPQKTEVSGDLAYDYGTYQLSLTPKNGGPPISDSGRYLVVLKRQSDGSWKLIADMDNSATPLPPPTQPMPAPTTTTSQ